MSDGPFKEAGDALIAASETAESINVPLSQADELADELHTAVTGVYHGVNAGDELAGRIDQGRDLIDQARTIFAGLVTDLRDAAGRAYAGNL